jgi:hypothetical protein
MHERSSHAEIVQGAQHALVTLLQDVGVGHGGGHIVVSDQVLNDSDVGAALPQVRGAEMAKSLGLMGFVRPARRTATVMARLMTLGST